MPDSFDWALAVADAGWFTTESLFAALDREDVATLLLHCMDVRVARQKGRKWWAGGKALEPLGPRHWRREVVLPPGWMKTAPRLGMWPISRAVDRWANTQAPSARQALVMTYPYYLRLRDRLRPDRTLYYNLDDYRLYWPQRADEVAALERRAVRESELTVCVSRFRADELRAAVPERADRIQHIPHGTPAWALSDRPWPTPAPPPADLAPLPRPRLGYVGSLEDRVDWELLARLADAFPDGSLVIVGRPPRDDDRSDWAERCRRVLARPNVHALGWRPQEQLGALYRAFDVVLIPYRVDHPFNLACSPTKIMDGLGSSRPIVATSIPECRLYADLFDVVDDAAGFVAAVAAIVAAGSDDGRAEVRLARAGEYACDRVARRIVDLLLQG